MKTRIVTCAFALAMFLGTCTFAQEQGTQTGTGQTTGGSQAAPQAPQVAQPPAAAPTQKPTRIRVSGKVQQAMLVHQVMPVYPPDAKAAHISGTVLLHVIIDKGGAVEKVEYISGPPELKTSATDAIKQWRYKPTLLNGEPVEVDTTIKVVFTLAG